MRYAIVAVLVLLAGCGEDAVIPTGNDPAPVALTKEDSVIANCYVLRDALEEWKVANFGLYPRYGTDRLYGDWAIPFSGTAAFMDFLPGGQLLINPYTGLQTEPLFDRLPGEAGQIGYWPLFVRGQYWFGLSYLILGYRIVALGEDWETLLVIEKDPAESTITPRQELIVLMDGKVRPVINALNTWSLYWGGVVFPDSVHHKARPDRGDLISFLGGGVPLVNPATGEQTEPRDGPALAPGQLGYEPLRATSGSLHGQVAGYQLTAFIDSSLTFTYRKDPDLP